MERKKNVSEVVVVRCYDGSGGRRHDLGGGGHVELWLGAMVVVGMTTCVNKCK
jgi:hypothetical protein